MGLLAQFYGLCVRPHCRSSINPKRQVAIGPILSTLLVVSVCSQDVRQVLGYTTLKKSSLHMNRMTRS